MVAVVCRTGSVAVSIHMPEVYASSARKSRRFRTSIWNRHRCPKMASSVTEKTTCLRAQHASATVSMRGVPIGFRAALHFLGRNVLDMRGNPPEVAHGVL